MSIKQLLCQIKGHPGYSKPANTTDDNRSSSLHCMWASRWIETIHNLTLLSFILVGKGAAFHTHRERNKALWALFRHETLKGTVFGFIICLQERTTVPQPQKNELFTQTETAPQSDIDPISIQSRNSEDDHIAVTFTIYKTARCSLILKQQSDRGGKTLAAKCPWLTSLD